MFSFRRDKTGFFVTIILMTIVGGTLVSTLVLLIVGIAQGDWKSHLLSVKWILGSAWVACIITVLIRLRIYKWQYDRAIRQRETNAANGQPESHAGEVNTSANSRDGGITS
jgi:hypothetical protein